MYQRVFQEPALPRQMPELAFGSYKAGNKNTFNEISAIMDELRRQGKISIKDIKGIFKLMKIK